MENIKLISREHLSKIRISDLIAGNNQISDAIRKQSELKFYCIKKNNLAIGANGKSILASIKTERELPRNMLQNETQQYRHSFYQPVNENLKTNKTSFLGQKSKTAFDFFLTHEKMPLSTSYANDSKLTLFNEFTKKKANMLKLKLEHVKFCKFFGQFLIVSGRSVISFFCFSKGLTTKLEDPSFFLNIQSQKLNSKTRQVSKTENSVERNNVKVNGQVNSLILSQNTCDKGRNNWALFLGGKRNSLFSLISFESKDFDYKSM